AVHAFVHTPLVHAMPAPQVWTTVPNVPSALHSTTSFALHVRPLFGSHCVPLLQLDPKHASLPPSLPPLCVTFGPQASTASNATTTKCRTPLLSHAQAGENVTAW